MSIKDFFCGYRLLLFILLKSLIQVVQFFFDFDSIFFFLSKNNNNTKRLEQQVRFNCYNFFVWFNQFR